ncbi:MAG: hypothetical protein VKJ64_18730 [Leptolyngbyaceae bacterium]|nr:hypothetical protein [Leptolyngbyaceae bacterium]
MQLSPITSYHLRKLFRQHCDRLQPLVQANITPHDHLIEANFEAAWQLLCQQQPEMGSIVQKLESLVSMHQALEKQGTIYSQDLASLERTIFNVLGFQIADISYKV